MYFLSICYNSMYEKYKKLNFNQIERKYLSIFKKNKTRKIQCLSRVFNREKLCSFTKFVLFVPISPITTETSPPFTNRNALSSFKCPYNILLLWGNFYSGGSRPNCRANTTSPALVFTPSFSNNLSRYQSIVL